MTALLAWPASMVGLLAGVAFGAVYIAIAGATSPVMGVAAVGGVLFLALLMRSPVIGLYVLAAVVPVERFGRLTDDNASFEISIMRMIGMVVFAVVVVHLLLRHRRPLVTTPLVMWTTYVTFAILSLTYSSDLQGGTQIISGAFGNILFLFSISSLVLQGNVEQTMHRARLAILIWLIACMVVATYSIYDWHFGSGVAGGIPISSVDPQAGAQLAEHRWSTVWEDTAERGLSGLSLRRSMGPTSHAAVFGINLLISVPFFIYAMRIAKSWPMVALFALGLAETAYCMLLTNTRSVVVIAVLTAGLCALWKLLPIRTWMVAAALAGCGLALVLLPPDIFNRILNVSNYEVQNSEALRIRLEYWEAGLTAIFDNWLMGVGVGNRLVMLSYLRNPIDGHSTMHNIYLQTALDVGLLGWLSFASFVGVLLLWTNRLRCRFRDEGRVEEHWLAAAAQAMMVTVIGYGTQVDVFFFPLKGWWLVSGIVIALYVNVSRESSRAFPLRPAVAR